MALFDVSRELEFLKPAAGGGLPAVNPYDDPRAYDREDRDLGDIDLTLRTGENEFGTLGFKIRVSEFVPRMLCWQESQYMSFKMRPWLPQIYDAEWQIRRRAHEDPSVRKRPRRRILMKTARQCEKSTQLGNKILTNCALIDGLTALYVSPGTVNTEEFADQRINMPMRISPRMGRWMDSALVNNQYVKRFRNNSRIVLRSANLNASRVRGIPADALYLDEFQDFLPENIPVIAACTKNSNLPMGPLFLLAGTPLSHENIIEQTWAKNSTQNTWMMRCSRCRTWNEPGPRQVTRKGLCCRKCGKALDVLGGQWVQAKESDDVTYDGYHLSQAMMPYTVADNLDLFEARWENFYRDVHDPNVAEAQILNELFGLSASSGKKPVSREQLVACSNPALAMNERVPDRVLNDPTWPVFAGVDWGEGSEDGAYTVIHIGYGNGDRFTVSYAKRYTGREAEAEFVKKDIARLLEINKVDLCIVDAGHGWGMIDSVRENITDGMNRVIPMRYSGNQSQVIQYDDKAHQLRAHRTRWMSKVFNMLINRQIVLPRWSDYEEPFGLDIMNIHADRSPKLKQMIYGHVGTDDSFHALLYSVTAFLLMYNQIDIFANS